MQGNELDKEDPIMEQNIFTDFMEQTFIKTDGRSELPLNPLKPIVEGKEEIDEGMESNINGNLIVIANALKIEKSKATSILHKILNFSELKDVKDKIIVSIRLK